MLPFDFSLETFRTFPIPRMQALLENL